MDNVALVPYLNILNNLPSAVWVYDQRSQAMVWGNMKALELWEVSSQEDLRKHCFNWLSEATVQLMGSYLQQFEHEFQVGTICTPHTDVWTVYPNSKPVTIQSTITGIRLSSLELWQLLHQNISSESPSNPPPPSDHQVYLLCQSAIPSDDFLAKELRSKEALRNTVANISLFSADGECLLENPAAIQTYSRAPLRNRFVDDSVSSEIMKVTSAAASKPYQDYVKMNTSNKEEAVRWFSVDARRIKDPVTGSHVVLLQTTDVHEFRKSQYKLSRVEEIAKIGTWEFDPHSEVLTCSPQFFRHFGCDPNRGRISFQDMLALVHPDDVAQVAASHANYLKGNMGSGELVMHVLPEDQSSTRTMLMHAECATDAEGRVTKLFGSCQDVSLLSTYAENLQTAEEFVKAIISHVHAGLLAVNAQGQLTLVNRNARHLHGISDSDELPDLPGLSAMLRDMDDNPINMEDTPMVRALAGEPVRNEHMKIVPNGKTLEEALIVSCSGQMLLKPDGTKMGAVLAVQNITEHKMAEKALRAAKEEAELASKLKSEFMANLSHEIRTPFNGILGMLSLALETEIPPIAREHLESALECTHFLLNIINTLLDFSKLETKHVELCPVPFLLRSSVGTILSLFEAHAREKKIVLELEVDADVPDSLFGDVDRLRQIVTHLVDNSIKFSKPPGHVAVHIELAQEQPSNPNGVELFFKVEDNGIGIPEEKQKLLFGSFYQVDGSSTRQQGGVGLGLAICENLVGLFGGKIWCTSVEGKGSTFCFTVQLERPSAKYHDKYTFRHRRSISTSVIEGNSPPQTYSSPPLPPSLAITTSSSSGSDNSSPAHSPRATSPIPFSPATFSALRSSAPPTTKIRFNSPSDSIRNSPLGTPPPPPTASPTSPSFPFPLLPSLIPAYSNRNTQHYTFPPPHFDKRRFSYAGPPSTYSSPTFNTSSTIRTPPPLRILLCEDNIMNQKVMVRMLQKYGHQITIANDGREGVSIFESADPATRFECILMDIQMPHMNGCEAAHRIRTIEKEKGLPYTPIIAVSAYVEEKDKFGAAGIDAYIAKPINQPALLETMYELTLRYKVDNNADSKNNNKDKTNNKGNTSTTKDKPADGKPKDNCTKEDNKTKDNTTNNETTNDTKDDETEDPTNYTNSFTRQSSSKSM